MVECARKWSRCPRVSSRCLRLPGQGVSSTSGAPTRDRLGDCVLGNSTISATADCGSLDEPSSCMAPGISLLGRCTIGTQKPKDLTANYLPSALLRNLSGTVDGSLYHSGSVHRSPDATDSNESRCRHECTRHPCPLPAKNAVVDPACLPNQTRRPAITSVDDHRPTSTSTVQNTQHTPAVRN